MKNYAIVDDYDDVLDLPETQTMYSQFPRDFNMSKEQLIALGEGKVLVDTSDGEFIHTIKLDSDAKDMLNKVM